MEDERERETKTTRAGEKAEGGETGQKRREIKA